MKRPPKCACRLNDTGSKLVLKRDFIIQKCQVARKLNLPTSKTPFFMNFSELKKSRQLELVIRLA